MTKEEFHTIISKPKSECDGIELHLQHLWENNNPKSLFFITGLDFSEMMRGKEDTSGVQIGLKNRRGGYTLGYIGENLK